MKIISFFIVTFGLYLSHNPDFAPAWMNAALVLFAVFVAGWSFGGVWYAKQAAKDNELLRQQFQEVLQGSSGNVAEIESNHKAAMKKSNLKFTALFAVIVGFSVLVSAYAPLPMMTNPIRKDVHETAVLLQKMDDMCKDAGVTAIEGSYLGSDDSVVCVSSGGNKKVVGSLPGEGQKSEDRFFENHKHLPEADSSDSTDKPPLG